jgi:23S rRNA (adenine2030-N6)-methyltransferase
MNYRHHFHAGNFADVAKHALLVRLLRALQQKPKGFLYLDTHAGRGGYDLSVAASGTTLARTPEWPDGIGRLWSRTDVPPELADYLQLVRQFDTGRGNTEPTVRFYPGSPWIAAIAARAEDRLALCEAQASEVVALQQELDSGPAIRRTGRISVHEMDGYISVRAMLPPPEKRALVLVDPPYEAQGEFQNVTSALRDGLRRMPNAVFALWYPLTERARVQEFLGAILGLEPPPTLVAELAIAGDSSFRKLKGCGLAIINPPWKFEAEARAVLDYLAPLLAQEPGGGARVTWLVEER